MQDDSLIHYGNILEFLSCCLFLHGIGGSFCMSIFIMEYCVNSPLGCKNSHELHR